MQGDVDSANPELRAVDEASTTPAPQVVGYVVDVLGDRVACFIAGVADARTLRRWQRSGQVPEEAGRRLQGALQAIFLLRQRYADNARIAPWFTWLNETLDDRSPAAVLHDAPSTLDGIEQATRKVLAAGRALLSGE